MSARPLYPVLRAGAVVVFGAALLYPSTSRRSPPPPAVEVEPSAWVDVSALEPGTVAFPVTKALAGQKKPPCEPRLEKEILGACWAPHAEKPPCPRGSGEYSGACYLAVRAPERPPTSVDP
jgi:hypothetical protein